VLQIVFNEISAGEISRLETLEQLELLDAFKVTQDTLQDIDGERFGKIERSGTSLFRFRAGDYRVYFEVVDDNVIVHRVLHKNTFSDLLFRTKLPVGEDEELSKSKHFWNLIEEGKNAQRL
jgi:mRNA-degrading endonuclease RelE of RelBE toxin-antitoxin system